MTTVVSTELEWFHKKSATLGHHNVIGTQAHNNKVVKTPEVRAIVCNISTGGAVSFTNVNLVNAFGKAAGVSILPKFCTDEQMAKDGITKSMTGYITTEKAFEEGAEICIITGWGRNKDKHITEDPGYRASSAMLAMAKEHCPIVVPCCGTVETAMYDFHGIESTVYNEKNLGVFPFTKADMHEDDPSLKDPITLDMDTITHMPMSRSRNISDFMVLNNDIVIQLISSESGVGIARSKDFQMNYVLTHPENEDISIPKEQIRDWKLYAECKIDTHPSDAKHILGIDAEIMFMDYKRKCMEVRQINLNAKNDSERRKAPELTPEQNRDIKKSIKNRWRAGLGTYANGLLTQLFRMLEDGSAYEVAPKYRPAENSGILIPEHIAATLPENNTPKDSTTTTLAAQQEQAGSSLTVQPA